MKNAQEKAGEAIRLFIMTDRMHKSVFDTLMQESGLHRSQHWILLFLLRNGETGAQKQIADFLGISPAAVAVSLKKLEALGYIERTVSQTDNRNRLVQLTAAGRQILEETRKRFYDVDLQMLKGLSDSQLGIFMDCNRIIQENLRSLGGAAVSGETGGEPNT